MADHHLEWHGEEAARYLRNLIVKRLHKAAITVKNQAKELLKTPGTGKGSGGRDKKGRFLKGVVTHSAPGEPPRKQTGYLRSRVGHEVDEETLTARVGTNVEYGKHLELGTRYGLAPRPWLRRALAEVASQINRIFAGD